MFDGRRTPGLEALPQEIEALRITAPRQERQNEKTAKATDYTSMLSKP